MSRPVFPILILSTVLVSCATEAVEARPKSFCRRWAAGVANSNVQNEQQGNVRATTLTTTGVAEVEDRDARKTDVNRLAGGGLGGAMARMSRSDRWNEIFKQAYADCRVVRN